jgi:cytoskeletal protein RodZ
MASHSADSSHEDEAHEAHAPTAEGDDVPHHGAPLPEPRSPAWLPLLGVALLAAVLVWWLSTPSDAEERAAAAAASASAAASSSASASANPTAVVASAQQLVPAPPRPTAPPNPANPANAPTFIPAPKPLNAPVH